jgi:hypothetical protein
MSGTEIRTIGSNSLSRMDAPRVARFAVKIVLDALPAVLASVIGGFLFTQYHSGHAETPLVAVQPASPEMMAMVRDEHTLIMDYLKAQMAAEKRRDAAEDAATARAAVEAHAAADAKLADALMASQAADRMAAAAPSVTAKAPAVRRKPPVSLASSTPHAPLAIAQANEPAPVVVAEAAPPDDRLASDPDSLLAKTLDLKDHVVAATRHAVSAIGDVFSSVGGSIGGVMSSSTRQFTPNS